MLEALAALVIVGAVGGPLLAAVAGAMRARATAEESDRRIQAADQAMQALTLLPRRDLERRLGRHELRGFIVEVQRPERTLFSVTLYQDSLADAPLLVTLLHRNTEAR